MASGIGACLRRASWVAVVSALAGCGADNLFVMAALGSDEGCDFVADPGRALDRALFDISEGASLGSDACAGGYIAHLLVDNPNSETVLVEGAEVKLTTIDDRTIVFSSADPPLLNPYRSTVASPVGGGRGVAAVELVPGVYAPFLSDFVGGKLLASVTLSGTTGDGSDVGSNGFDLAIEICDGCRTVCLQRDVYDAGLVVDDVTGNSCRDSSGADDRFCIDPGC